MSLLTNILSAAIKTALVPVAIVRDVVDVATGETPEATMKTIDSAMSDVKDGMDDLADGELL